MIDRNGRHRVHLSIRINEKTIWIFGRSAPYEYLRLVSSLKLHLFVAVLKLVRILATNKSHAYAT